MSTVMSNVVDNSAERFLILSERIIDGGEITFDEAFDLTKTREQSVPLLARAADRIRRRFTDNRIDLCSIINARSGRCPEDCKFCAQSSRYETGAPVYPMKSVSEIVEAAKTAEEAGAHRFCIVTSGDALTDQDFETVVTAVRKIKEETGMRRCASVGSLTPERTARLARAGLNRYHHNVETAAGFFPEVCATHTYGEKLATISNLETAGIEKCVGGILNMGESPRQRIEFAFELKELAPVSVPINFLDPRPGTPLAERPPITAAEAIKYLSIFRFVLPRTYIRLAGGRAETFAGNPSQPFTTGVNGLLIGDLLTTEGPSARADLEMLAALGFEVGV